MAERPYPDRLEWAFMSVYIVAIALILLSWAFFPAFISGVFAGIAIDCITAMGGILLWIRSSSAPRS
jgi:hypothetical protein